MKIWIFLVKGIIKLTGLKWVTICHRIINVRNILPKSIAIHIKNYVSGLKSVFILHNIPMENNLAAGITIVILYLQKYKKIYTTDVLTLWFMIHIDTTPRSYTYFSEFWWCKLSKCISIFIICMYWKFKFQSYAWKCA